MKKQKILQPRIFRLIKHYAVLFLLGQIVASQSASLPKTPLAPSQSASLPKTPLAPSQSASKPKTSSQVTSAILSNDKLNPKPILSIGHSGAEDKMPLTPISNPDKPFAPIPTPEEVLIGNLLQMILSDASSSPQLSRRDARTIIGALDRQTCFAKVLCGLGREEPSKSTDLINDYAYLIGDLVVNSEESTNKSSSFLTEIWDEFGSPLQDQEELLESDEGAESEEDVDVDKRLGLPYLHLRPYHRLVHVPRRRILFLRRQRQLGGRQCRQLMERNKCPYNGEQMAKIVSKLRGIIRGEDLLSTITMTVLGGASQAMASIRRSPTAEPATAYPGKMNVIINLQQNFSMPPAPVTGYATVPLSMSALQYRAPGSDKVKDNEILSARNESGVQDNLSSFKPFYILPLLQNVETTTTPTFQEATTSQNSDPLKELVGFLYSVGYAKNGSQPVATTPPPKENEDDSEEGFKILSDFAFSKPSQARRKVLKGRGSGRRKIPKSFDSREDNHLDKEADGWIRIKSSQRTGRFQRVGGETSFRVRPAPHPQLIGSGPGREVPMFVRALRFLSSIMRGGRL